MLEKLEKYNFWSEQDIPSGFQRERYLSYLRGYLKKGRLVKVLKGQRRAGKSYLMRALIKHLIKELGVERRNILYINKELEDLEFIRDRESLLGIIKEYRKKFNPKGRVYLFIDEIQEIKEWEKVVNSLSQDYVDETEIFITGSNSKLLSGELATYLAGRYVEMEVFPFSYQEFLSYKGLERSKNTLLTYLESGGFPESYNFSDPELVKNYMLTLKDSIVLRDVVQRHEVRDVYLLQRLVHFLIDSTGKLFSTNSISKYLRSIGYKTNVETIGNYLDYLRECYFSHAVERFDLQGKKILGGEKKFYLNDLGFKSAISSTFDTPFGSYLENLVYLSLRRSGYKVYVGTLRQGEVDFVAEKDNSKLYIQVAYVLSSDEVISREFGNLEKVSDHFPKLVISMDDLKLSNTKGIMHEKAWDFIV